MDEIKQVLTQRIIHSRKRISKYKKLHGENPSQTHTYHGGWDLGYWEGKLSALEDLFDEIVEMEN